ncbi:MAG: hypothetical protein V7676_17010 [Parasphingorhabdus sp.]|jgi:hypothetical protein|uniref:hypothetical protein n=1 Tax=Parasphingorhabdus sp. TaxID=2709688 RepID=UPI0030012E1A
MRKILCATILSGLVGLSVQPALAAQVEDLTCLDDQLDEGQRAEVGALFAEQTDDPTDDRVPAKGSEAAAEDFAVALGGCADRFEWSEAKRSAAGQYLIQLGALSKIAVANGQDWSRAMESYASFGQRLITDQEKVTDHQRAMIVAGAKANGVPSMEGDEGEDSQIIAYMLAKIDLDSARENF